MLLEQEVTGLGAVTVDDDGDPAGAAGLAGRALAELGTVLGLEGDGVVGHEALLADEAGPGAPRLMVVRLGATTRSTARYHHVDHGCAPAQGASLAGATWARLRHGRTPRTARRRWGASPAATSRGGLDDVDTTSCDHGRTDGGCYPGRRAVMSLRIAEAADSLVLGPRATRLAMRAVISGRSSSTCPGGVAHSMLTPPPRPGTTVIGTPEWRSRSTSRATVRSVTPSSLARRLRVSRFELVCSRSMRCCWRSTRRRVRYGSREAADACPAGEFMDSS